MHFPARKSHHKQVIEPSRSTWKKSAVNSKENYLHLQIMLLRKITMQFRIKTVHYFQRAAEKLNFLAGKNIKKGLDTTYSLSMLTYVS